MTTQVIVRKCTFDSGHRVMNERQKCFSPHGHLYQVELGFEFIQSEEIGYNIDFKEIKRIGCQWIDDMLDHGFIANPEDYIMITACKEVGGKVWEMSLNGKGKYCNPTVENIAKELFLAMGVLFNDFPGLKIKTIRLYETLNCFTDCTGESITSQEHKNWLDVNYELVLDYAKKKGVVEYDDRKINTNKETPIHDFAIHIHDDKTAA